MSPIQQDIYDDYKANRLETVNISPNRSSVVHLDDKSFVDLTQSTGPLRCEIEPNTRLNDSAIQPMFIPQEITTVCVQPPMSLDDPYDSATECSGPNEVIVEFFGLQSSGGLEIEAYKPRVGRQVSFFNENVKPGQPYSNQRSIQSSRVQTLSLGSSRSRPGTSQAPCNTFSQALDVTDLSTDVSGTRSIENNFKNYVNVRTKYFKRKEVPTSLSTSTNQTNLLDKPSYTRTNHVVSTSNLSLSRIVLNMPEVRAKTNLKGNHNSIQESPKKGLLVLGHTFAYPEPPTPNRKRKILKETDLLRVIASDNKPVKNALNEDLLSLSHPLAHDPSYRSALYTGDVRSLYIQISKPDSHMRTSKYSEQKIKRLMRPTLSSAEKVSTYAKYLRCTDLIKNLPLEGDDYAHPDNNISINVDYITDTQLHLGADKAPLPVFSMSAVDRLQHDLLAEQLEERYSNIRLLTKNKHRRPRSAPLRPEFTDKQELQRPKSAVSTLLFNSNINEINMLEGTPNVKCTLKHIPDSQRIEGTCMNTNLRNTPLSLVKRSCFSPTLAPLNHILAIKKANLQKYKQKLDYAGEECSSMDQFSSMGSSDHIKSRARSTSAPLKRTQIKIMGQRIEKIVTAPQSLTRQKSGETNRYGDVISPHMHVTDNGEITLVPLDNIACTNAQKAEVRVSIQMKQAQKRAQQLASPETLQDMKITSRWDNNTDWNCSTDNPLAKPPRITINTNTKRVLTDIRFNSSIRTNEVKEQLKDYDIARSQSANTYANYEHMFNKELEKVDYYKYLDFSTAKLTFATPVSNSGPSYSQQPSSPKRSWKSSNCPKQLEEVQENNICTDRRSTVTSCVTNFSSLTQITSKSTSSAQTGTFSQWYSRGRQQYYSTHQPEVSRKRNNGSITGHSATSTWVPYGGLVSPHKNCLLVNIDEEERLAYASGQYLDPTGLVRSVRLATNLSGSGRR